MLGKKPPVPMAAPADPGGEKKKKSSATTVPTPTPRGSRPTKGKVETKPVVVVDDADGDKDEDDEEEKEERRKWGEDTTTSWQAFKKLKQEKAQLKQKLMSAESAVQKMKLVNTGDSNLKGHIRKWSEAEVKFLSLQSELSKMHTKSRKQDLKIRQLQDDKRELLQKQTQQRIHVDQLKRDLAAAKTGMEQMGEASHKYVAANASLDDTITKMLDADTSIPWGTNPKAKGAVWMTEKYMATCRNTIKETQESLNMYRTKLDDANKEISRLIAEHEQNLVAARVHYSEESRKLLQKVEAEATQKWTNHVNTVTASHQDVLDNANEKLRAQEREIVALKKRMAQSVSVETLTAADDNNGLTAADAQYFWDRLQPIVRLDLKSNNTFTDLVDFVVYEVGKMNRIHDTLNSEKWVHHLATLGSEDDVAFITELPDMLSVIRAISWDETYFRVDSSLRTIDRLNAICKQANDLVATIRHWENQLSTVAGYSQDEFRRMGPGELLTRFVSDRVREAQHPKRDEVPQLDTSAGCNNQDLERIAQLEIETANLRRQANEDHQQLANRCNQLHAALTDAKRETAEWTEKYQSAQRNLQVQSDTLAHVTTQLHETEERLEYVSTDRTKRTTLANVRAILEMSPAVDDDTMLRELTALKTRIGDLHIRSYQETIMTPAGMEASSFWATANALFNHTDRLLTWVSAVGGPDRVDRWLDWLAVRKIDLDNTGVTEALQYMLTTYWVWNPDGTVTVKGGDKSTADLREELSRNRDQLHKVEVELRQEKGRLIELETRHAKLQHALNDRNELVNSLQRQTEQLKHEAKASRDAATEWQDELVTAKARVRRLEIQRNTLEDANESIRALNEQIDSQRSQMSMMEREIATLKTDLQSQKDPMEVAQDEKLDAVRNSMKQQRQRLLTLETENQQLVIEARKYRRLAEQLTEFQNRFHREAKAHADCRVEVADLKRKYEAACSESDTWNDPQYAERKTQLLDELRDLKELDAKMQHLATTIDNECATCGCARHPIRDTQEWEALMALQIKNQMARHTLEAAVASRELEQRRLVLEVEKLALTNAQLVQDGERKAADDKTRRDMDERMMKMKESAHEDKSLQLRAKLAESFAECPERQMYRFDYNENKRGTELTPGTKACLKPDHKVMFFRLWETRCGDGTFDDSYQSALSALAKSASHVIENLTAFKSYLAFLSPNLLAMRMELARNIDRPDMYLFQTGPRHSYTFHKLDRKDVVSIERFELAMSQYSFVPRGAVVDDDTGYWCVDFLDWTRYTNRFPHQCAYATVKGPEIVLTTRHSSWLQLCRNQAAYGFSNYVERVTRPFVAQLRLWSSPGGLDWFEERGRSRTVPNLYTAHHLAFPMPKREHVESAKNSLVMRSTVSAVMGYLEPYRAQMVAQLNESGQCEYLELLQMVDIVYHLGLKLCRRHHRAPAFFIQQLRLDASSFHIGFYFESDSALEQAMRTYEMTQSAMDPKARAFTEEVLRQTLFTRANAGTETPLGGRFRGDGSGDGERRRRRRLETTTNPTSSSSSYAYATFF